MWTWVGWCFFLCLLWIKTLWISDGGVCGPCVFPVTQPTVRALKKTYSTDLSQWPGLILSSSTTKLLRTSALVPLCHKFHVSTLLTPLPKKTSGQSNLTRPHRRHGWTVQSYRIELLLPSAHPSPQPKLQIDQLSHFYTAECCRAH